MAVCFDVFCPKCGHELEDVMIDVENSLPKCPVCDSEMKKMMGTTSFKLKFCNRTDICDWDGNSSAYWNDIKEKGGDEPVNPRQAKWY